MPNHTINTISNANTTSGTTSGTSTIPSQSVVTAVHVWWERDNPNCTSRNAGWAYRVYYADGSERYGRCCDHLGTLADYRTLADTVAEELGVDVPITIYTTWGAPRFVRRSRTDWNAL